VRIKSKGKKRKNKEGKRDEKERKKGEVTRYPRGCRNVEERE
jgi:hypothetical protein